MKKVTLLTLMALTSLTAAAKPQTVTLDVPTMNCVTCPFTVKKSLQNVAGVSVTFDDEKTTVKALIDATTNAGYPSTIKQ